MTGDQLSVAYLLGALAEACEAREWRFRLEHDRWPRLTAWRCCLLDEHGFGFFLHNGETAQEAMAGTWAELTRWCRKEAARGRV